MNLLKYESGCGCNFTEIGPYSVRIFPDVFYGCRIDVRSGDNGSFSCSHERKITISGPQVKELL